MTQYFEKLRANKDRLSARQYNKMADMVGSSRDALQRYGRSDSTGHISRPPPIPPEERRVYRARMTEAVDATDHITCNLIEADGTEVDSGEFGFEIEVYFDISGGSAMNDALPRLADDEYLSCFQSYHTDGTLRWYGIPPWQASIDCECDSADLIAVIAPDAATGAMWFDAAGTKELTIYDGAAWLTVELGGHDIATVAGGLLTIAAQEISLTEANVEAAIDTLANLTSIQGQTVTLANSLEVEAAAAVVLNQDLTTDATVTFGDIISDADVHALSGEVHADELNAVTDVTTPLLIATTIDAFQAIGAIDFNSQNMTNVDIDSGTLGGITIDGNWTAAGQTCADLGTVTTATAITCAGAMTAEQLTSTDDITMAGHLLTMGDVAAATDTVLSFLGSTNTGSITFDESADEFDFGDAMLTTSGDINMTAGDFYTGKVVAYGDADTHIWFSIADTFLFTAGGVQLMKFLAGKDSYIAINDTGVDVDFFVESDNDTQLFYCNAGTDAIGISTNAPTGKVEIEVDDAAAIPCLTLDQNDISEGTINFEASDRGIIAATSSAVSVRVELSGVVYRLALYADA